MGSFEYPVSTHRHLFVSEVSGAVLTYSAILYNFAVCIVSVGLDGFAQSVSHQICTNFSEDKRGNEVGKSDLTR